MNDIAVIICNYNGKDITIKSLEAVLNSRGVLCDIYVIDNASTDGSVEQINMNFGGLVIIIQNSKNFGGAGGFGRGLRIAVEKGYPYIMMLDNDAYVDTNTIEGLLEYLRENPDVGIVGAKIMMADDPERIMDYAKTINFSTYIDESKWCRQLDSEKTSVPRDCDFVAATAAMVRKEALIKCGGMDESYFIYYDDIDMGYRIKMSGFRVVSLGSVRVWHDSGMCKKVTNTFARYYLTRNRYYFFAKYIPESDIERFTEYVLSKTFSYLYGAHYKERRDIFDTEKYILEDFIKNRRGEAGAGRINKIQKDRYRRIDKVLSGLKRVCLYLEEDVEMHSAIKFCSRLWEKETEAVIVIYTGCGMREKAEDCQKQLKYFYQKESIKLELTESIDKTNYDRVIHLCSHVKNVTKNMMPDIFIDTHDNIIVDEQDYIYFRNYDKVYSFFKDLYHDSIIETIYKIRKEKESCLIRD